MHTFPVMMEGPTGPDAGEDEGEDVLAAPDYRLARGMEFKRVVRAAAALQSLYDDSAIAAAVKRSRNTVASWWAGATPEPPTLLKLAEATGLDPEELFAYVYRDGPPPKLVEPGSPLDQAVSEAARRDRERQRPGDPEQPEPSPRPRPGETD